MSLKILFIGNSFSVDTLEHVNNIAKGFNINEVKIVNLYVGGCSIKKHFYHATNNINAYERFINIGNGWTSTYNHNIKDSILEDSWDYICIQHGSADGSKYSDISSYSELKNLISYIKNIANKNAKIVFNMTWVGEPSFNHHEIIEYNKDTKALYEDIVKLTKKHIVSMDEIDYVVPIGTAIEYARKQDIGLLTRDGYHLSLSTGRYIAGLMFLKTLLNINASNTTFFLDDMSEKERKVAIDAVNYASSNPFNNKDKSYKIALFDLDGTLTDPKEGLINSIIYALDKYNIKVKEKESLLKFIGPPLVDSFKEFYGFDENKAKEATEYYREYYKVKGVNQNTIYPYIKEMLKVLYDNNIKIGLATSKPKVFAVQILETFDILKYFTFVSGATLDGTLSKKDDIINHALENLKVKDKSEVIMIGDRKFDIIGSKTHNLDSIGVLYGYGDYKELSEYNATYIVNTALEIVDIIIKK